MMVAIAAGLFLPPPKDERDVDGAGRAVTAGSPWQAW